MTANELLLGQSFTDRDLIESVVASFFIVDYGVINKVNADKTVNVTHAKIQELTDGTKLPALETKNLEVLTITTAGFSINPEVKAGDKVLLLGLKDYVPAVKDVDGAKDQEAYLHYKRDGMKALPLCVFNADAKVKIEIADGTLKAEAKENIQLKGKKIELNGNAKHFVTYTELDNALQQLLTSLKSHTHPVSTTGSAAAQTGTAAASIDLSTVTLDISSAETKNICTE